MVPSRFLSILSSYRPPIQIWVPTWIDEILIYLIQSFFYFQLQVGSEKIAIRYNRKLIFLTMARLRLPLDMHFTQKTYYFQKIVTSLLPYYHNLFVMFVIFEKNWRLWKKTAKTAFFNVDLGTLAKFSIYLLISPLEPKKKVSTSRKQILNNTSCPFVEFLCASQS